jgi:hypothetical protein
MARLDARVGKLETQLGATSPRVVVMFAEAGESSTDCIRRHGQDPHSPGIRYIVVSWQKGDE